MKIGSAGFSTSNLSSPWMFLPMRWSRLYRAAPGNGNLDYDFYLELFLVNCKHPSGSNLIFWPNLVPELPQDREPTPEEIAELAIGHRAEPSAAADRGRR